jgi:DnaK suppressor protein
MFADGRGQHLFSGDCRAARQVVYLRSLLTGTEGGVYMTATAPSGAAALAIRAGEERWTETELKQVRQQLEVEAVELRSDIERAESDIASRLSDTTGDAGDDQADAGAKTFEREHDLALTYTARELLAQADHALARMADGSYGTCESCGEPIGKARLQAFPRAVLCVSCKQREERR